jgi:hypothetical protein
VRRARQQGPAGSGVSATTLRVDAQANPIGLGDATPALSWRLSSGRQSAYQIRVASSAAQLDQPDLWDSGKVTDVQRLEQRHVCGSSAEVPARGRLGRARVGRQRRGRRLERHPHVGDGAARQQRLVGDPDYTYATGGMPNPPFRAPPDSERMNRPPRCGIHGFCPHEPRSRERRARHCEPPEDRRARGELSARGAAVGGGVLRRGEDRTAPGVSARHRDRVVAAGRGGRSCCAGWWAPGSD